MNLSKRQKMMLGGLGLALGAFVINAMLPGPSAASAGMQADTAVQPAGSASTAVTGTAGPRNTNASHEALMRVVDRLRSVDPGDDDEGAGLPDPFAPARGAVIAVSQETPLEMDMPFVTPQGEQSIERAVRVAPTIRISSILNAPEGRLALIDGEFRREGDRMGDWVITRIAERSIRLSDGSREILVPMDR